MNAKISLTKAKVSLNEFELYIPDFEISEGIYIVNGMNGSGKSTFLRTILGVFSLSSGEIYRQPGFTLGYIPQEYRQALFPWMTAKKNLHVFGELPDGESMLNSLGFDNSDLSKKPPHLSGGQCQRIVLVREILRNPNVLVADEPFSALDNIAFMNALEALFSFTNNGGMVILTSHIEIPKKFLPAVNQCLVRRVNPKMAILEHGSAR